MAMPLSSVTELTIMLVLLCVPRLGFSYFERLPLPPKAAAPYEIVFDREGGGPYTSVVDGRVLKYSGPKYGFQDFAYVSPTRSKALCDGNTNPLAFGGACGRPFGLGFSNSSEELYIGDATGFGLSKVSLYGGLSTQVVSTAGGQKLKIIDGIELDQFTGEFFLTDASAVYNVTQIPQAIAANDSTASLIKYDPIKNASTVLLRNLSGVTGAALSLDGSYLLVPEFIGQRISKYWLQGPKANTAEVLIKFQGRPEKISRTTVPGEYWVPLNKLKTPTSPSEPTAIKIDGFGRVLASFSLAKEYNTSYINRVVEHGGAFYVGSLDNNVTFVGKYKF